MGRPKGCKTKPKLDPNNIIKSSNTENDVNGNPSPTKQSLPSRSKSPIASEVLISLTEIKCKKIIDSLITKFTDFKPQEY